MEFLWQKESVHAHSLYRNLFANIENDFPNFKDFNKAIMSVTRFDQCDIKKNTLSDNYRQDGNKEFANGQWETAIKYYNESLCCAEPGTENVSFAYGNRSACHIELKWYKECLADIELTLNEAKCPPDILKLKLEQRKDKCLKALSLHAANNLFEVKLSYKADKKFPFMAEVLDIQKNAEFGRHVVAKCNIPAGKTIALEHNFVTFTEASIYVNKSSIRCISCNYVSKNPVPCLKCTTVMFCKTECRNGDKIHQMDCGAFYYTHDVKSNKFVIQSVLAAVILFPTIDDLMKFVEDAVFADKFEIPTSALDPKSKYRMFLKLWMPPSPIDDFILITYRLFNTIMRVNEVKTLFNSTRKKRFLIHLLGHHTAILMLNSMNGQMSVFTSLFSHSCAPNVQEVFIGNRTASITIRPIKKGEQIFCSYTMGEIMEANGVDHKDEIYAKFRFRCKCIKCENKLASVTSIKHDPLFQQLDTTELDDIQNKVELQDFITNCNRLLNRYNRMPWSTQLDYVSKKLGHFLKVFHNYNLLN